MLQFKASCSVMAFTTLIFFPIESDQVKLNFRKTNGQWYTGKTTSCSDIRAPGTSIELNDFCYSQRMKDVTIGKVIDVLSRNHIDLCIPFTIQGLRFPD